MNVLTPALNPGAPPFTAMPTSSNFCTNGKKAVLLQTARASIYNPNALLRFEYFLILGPRIKKHSSPFLLNATIKYHLEHYLDSHPNLIQGLLHSTYVDDITRASSEDEAFDLCTPSKEILHQRGFNL